MIKNILLPEKLFRIAIIFIIVFSCFFIFTNNILLAQDANNMLWNGEANRVPADTGLGNQSPYTIVANILNIILGFLGFGAVIIVLYGGFKWMTAAGNNDQVDEAKKIIMAGVIGIIIIISAFSISAYVINQMYNVTEGT